MTRDEFIDGYCKKSGITREFFFENGDAVPCDCGEDGCAGWQYDTSRSPSHAIHLTGSAAAPSPLPLGAPVYFFQDAADAGRLRFSMSGKTVVCLKPDGTIEMGEGYTPTEAAEEFIAILRDALPGYLQKPRAALDYANRKLELYAARIAALEGGIVAENNRVVTEMNAQRALTARAEQQLASVMDDLEENAKELDEAKDLLVGLDEDFHAEGHVPLVSVIERILDERDAARSSADAQRVAALEHQLRLCASALRPFANAAEHGGVTWDSHGLPECKRAREELDAAREVLGGKLYVPREHGAYSPQAEHFTCASTQRDMSSHVCPVPPAPTKVNCECLDWTQVGHPASAYWPDLHPNYHHPDCAKYVAPLACENCGARATHAEHFYDRVRSWCEAHVPWSGHHEYCGDACRALLDAGRGQ